ncbi:hypothetical protein [Anaeroselena agilis]|uniref:Uncharacterized protein n=1 Tax=Anaeroselena agilis TaxID=3063788 RepID=A0ABU3NZA9_9FIRM|nr:hypothetical protein [Selenomonadales bacterium 4137-cl]
MNTLQGKTGKERRIIYKLNGGMMMGRKLLISLMILLVFIFSGVACAAENPFKGLTQEQIIQKYFAGRQLDPIEGIWLDERKDLQIILKTALIDTQKNTTSKITLR